MNYSFKFRPLKQCSEIPEYIDLSDTTKLIQEADISLFCPARNRIHYFDGGGRMAVEFQHTVDLIRLSETRINLSTRNK